ncbi:outer membrane beta-barrel protein [Spirosoma spitsbergense]|uniref:outer membrane beta-barrel protein n=1 Tax=Spirosoma spitsbergense TaxID=431554 RepID=UPI000368DE26|nr:outer membrane beta-barrel protein [Spirosoma spitsbergense]
MIRKLSFLAALVFFTSTFSWGQPSLSVSATGSPTFSRIVYGYRYFYPESDGQVVEPVYVNGPRWATGYSAGLSVRYEYTPGWSVSSGIWYQSVSFRQARRPSAGEGMVTLRNRVVRFPILLNYALSSKRLSPYFSLGFLVDLPLTGRVVVTRGTESTQNLRLKTKPAPIFQGMLGAGVQYKLTERYTLLAQPVWTYTFGQLGGSLTNDPTFDLSLLTQVAYSF